MALGIPINEVFEKFIQDWSHFRCELTSPVAKTYVEAFIVLFQKVGFPLGNQEIISLETLKTRRTLHKECFYKFACLALKVHAPFDLLDTFIGQNDDFLRGDSESPFSLLLAALKTKNTQAFCTFVDVLFELEEEGNKTLMFHALSLFDLIHRDMKSRCPSSLKAFCHLVNVIAKIEIEVGKEKRSALLFIALPVLKHLLENSEHIEAFRYLVNKLTQMGEVGGKFLLSQARALLKALVNNQRDIAFFFCLKETFFELGEKYKEDFFRIVASVLCNEITSQSWEYDYFIKMVKESGEAETIADTIQRNIQRYPLGNPDTSIETESRGKIIGDLLSKDPDL